MNPIWEQECSKHDQEIKPWVKTIGYILGIPAAILFWYWIFIANFFI